MFFVFFFKIDTSRKSKWADSSHKHRKLNPKSDYNNNDNEIKCGEVSHSIKSAGISNQVPKKSLAFQYDQFSESNKSRSHSNHSRSRDEVNQYQSQSTSSRFIQFFEDNLLRPNASEEMERSKSSASLNDFFKKAVNSQKKTEVLRIAMPHHTSEDIQSSKRSKNINTNEMTLVDELEAQWRQNVATRETRHESNKSETFKKLICQLNSQSAQKSEQAHTQHKSQHNFGYNNSNDENLTNIFFKNYQKYQQQPTGVNQLNILQQHYYKQNALLQQQQATLLANLQLKTILTRPEAQMYLLGLAKGINIF